MKFVAFAALLSLATHSIAQPYPSRPVRLVIPFAPGGLVDVPGRVLAQRLTDALGQPVVVENRAGAGSTIGADHVAKSKPDGYTLLMTSTTHVISANLYRTLPYDSLRDFTAVMKLTEGPYVLVVNPALKAASVAELVALARERPGRIDYGSSGNGSSQHLVAALFCTMAGAPLNHVPYKGSDRAAQDLIGGQVMVGFVGTPIALPHVKNARLRALAVSTATRSAQMPDVPTLAEAGVKDAESGSWIAILAPTGVSSSVVEKINADIKEAVALPEVREKLIAQGAVPQASTPKELQALIDADLKRYGRIIREQGLKAE